jgi:hypothetical protein
MTTIKRFAAAYYQRTGDYGHAPYKLSADARFSRRLWWGLILFFTLLSTYLLMNTP